MVHHDMVRQSSSYHEAVAANIQEDRPSTFDDPDYQTGPDGHLREALRARATASDFRYLHSSVVTYPCKGEG